MRVLVTGVKGQLGFDCMRELNERGFFDVCGVDVSDFDISQEKEVAEYVSQYRPEAIIHCAGYTAVDLAELEKEKACRINVLGTKYLAQAAENIGAKFVYISTDYVFPGKGDYFQETIDATKPLNYYGETKLEGERKAKEYCSRLFIVRISWAFGLNGNNFVKTMLKLGESHRELKIVNDQIGSPTYTRDLSKLLVDMILTEKYGVYHATNDGVCSWAEFAAEIFKKTNMDVIVCPVATKDYLKEKPIQAKRPLNSRLSKKSLEDAGFSRLPTWQDALDRYLKELKVI